MSRINNETQDLLEKKRKGPISKQLDAKKIKLTNVNNSTSEFCDLIIKLQHSDDDETINHQVQNNIIQMLKKKLSTNSCSDLCLAHLPAINYDNLKTFREDVHAYIFGSPNMNLLDGFCGKANMKYALDCIETFIKEQDEFSVTMKELKEFSPNVLRCLVCENNVDLVETFTIEYRKCGRKCVY